MASSRETTAGIRLASLRWAMGVILLNTLLVHPSLALDLRLAQDSSPSSGLYDQEPPVIEHEPMRQSVDAKQNIKIEATIIDNHGIYSATLFYRTNDMQDYRALAMQISSQDPTKFNSTIPGSDVWGKKLEYYIQATDTGGNTVLRGGRLFPISIAINSPPPAPSMDPAQPAATTIARSPADLQKRSEANYWPWIIGGALVGALIAANSDDGGDPTGGSGTQTGSATINFGTTDTRLEQ